MIVYVESNFVLEIALGQEQRTSADAILSMAEQGKIELAFPSFALSEPFATIMYRSGKRSSLYSSLETTLRQIKRSENFKQIVQDMEPFVAALRQAQKGEFDLLNATVERMLTVGRPIETDILSFREALRYQVSLDLFPQDSIIYATMINDLKKRPEKEVKCFLSRDKKAFSEEDDPVAKERNKNRYEARRRINAELRQYGCQCISTFDDGWNFVQRFA